MMNAEKLKYIYIVGAIIIYSTIIYGFGINSGLSQDYLFKKILQFQKIITNNKKKEAKSLSKKIQSNDFFLTLKNDDYKYKTYKTVGVVDINGIQKIFDQEDILALWQEHNVQNYIKDARPYLSKNGGIKRVFKYDKNIIIFATLSTIDSECIFGSLINLTASNEIFRMPCLKDIEHVDLNGMGGGVANYKDGVLFATGTPTPDDPVIEDLAQDRYSPYGKILFFDGKRLKGNSKESNKDYKIYSLGHRNPEGLANIGGKIYAVEHGPRGGDEVNLIKDGKNYGWPLFSLGSRYSGMFHTAVGTNDYVTPFFSFQPSIGISDLVECPSVLKSRYKGLGCILISSLREESIFILLIDNNEERVVSIEKIFVGMRVREFFLPNLEANANTDDIAVTTDGYGSFKLVFNKIPASN